MKSLLFGLIRTLRLRACRCAAGLSTRFAQVLSLAVMKVVDTRHLSATASAMSSAVPNETATVGVHLAGITAHFSIIIARLVNGGLPQTVQAVD